MASVPATISCILIYNYIFIYITNIKQILRCSLSLSCCSVGWTVCLYWWEGDENGTKSHWRPSTFTGSEPRTGQPQPTQITTNKTEDTVEEFIPFLLQIRHTPTGCRPYQLSTNDTDLSLRGVSNYESTPVVTTPSCAITRQPEDTFRSPTQGVAYRSVLYPLVTPDSTFRT